MADLISQFQKEPESDPSLDKKQKSDRQQGKKIRFLLPLGVLLAGAGLSVAYFLSQPKDAF